MFFKVWWISQRTHHISKVASKCLNKFKKHQKQLKIFKYVFAIFLNFKTVKNSNFENGKLVNERTNKFTF